MEIEFLWKKEWKESCETKRRLLGGKPGFPPIRNTETMCTISLRNYTGRISSDLVTPFTPPKCMTSNFYRPGKQNVLIKFQRSSVTIHWNSRIHTYYRKLNTFHSKSMITIVRSLSSINMQNRNHIRTTFSQSIYGHTILNDYFTKLW